MRLFKKKRDETEERVREIIKMRDKMVEEFIKKNGFSPVLTDEQLKELEEKGRITSK